MAKEMGLLNPGFSGSTVSLDRRSSRSINAISNAFYGDGSSENTYNTLQRNNMNNVTPRPAAQRPHQGGQNASYEDVGPGSGNKASSKTSITSKKLRRAKQRRRERMTRVVLMSLIICVAIVAFLLAVMLMMGKVGPKCCGTSDASPRAGKLSSKEPKQTNNTSEQANTFNMDLSPFYDTLEDLQANISSLQKEAESLMKESQGNKDSLVEAKTAFNQTREAIRLYSNQFYAVVDHVNSSVQQFDPDHGPLFSRLQALNATLANKLADMKRNYEQYNDAIDNAIDSMNATIIEKVAAKILEPGPIGERGRNGSKGPTGEKGQPGLQGPRGDKGPEGDQGDKGLPGDNGFPGTNGRKGLTGDTGSKGPKGDNGTVGPTGDTGVQGPRGIGNFSWCQHKKVSVKKDDIPGQKATASDNQNIKIVGASCTTDYGEEYNLQVTQSGNSNEYECVCKGIGTTHPAIQSSQVNCILYYWECPIQAP